MKTAHHREPVDVNRWPRLAANFRGLAVVLVGSLLLVSCDQADDRFPAYFRYKVDVKVDGVPVTIERVIKCTGFRYWTSYSPGQRQTIIYANPPIIGAKVPNSAAAVYAPVPDACGWAAGFKGDYWQEPPVKPRDKRPIVWVKDRDRFLEIEYYPSLRGLSGQEGPVEFVQLHPLEKATATDFLKSESRAKMETPDLTPFIALDLDHFSGKGTPYSDARPSDKRGSRFVSCRAAWIIGRDEWSRVPGLASWVDSLSDDGLAHRPPKELWTAFRETLPISEGKAIALRNGLKLEPLSPSLNKRGGGFANFDRLHPVITVAKDPYVDLSRKGVAGCIDEMRYYSHALAQTEYYSSFKEVSKFSYFEDKITISLVQYDPFYLMQLDSFVVFDEIPLGQRKLSEIIEAGVTHD